MHTAAPFVPFLIAACISALVGYKLESWAARFMDFWFPGSSRSREELKTVVKGYRYLAYGFACLLILSAILGKLGII